MYTICPPRGGDSRFQVTGKIEGRKVVKFDKYFFGGWLGLSRDFWLFWTIWRFLIVPAHPGHVVLRLKYNQTCFLFWRFLRLRNSVWDFWGVNFWCRDFFFGFDFGPIRSFLSLEIRSTSPRNYMGTCRRKGAVFQLLSPSIGCLKRQGLNCWKKPKLRTNKTIQLGSL